MTLDQCHCVFGKLSFLRSVNYGGIIGDNHLENCNVGTLEKAAPTITARGECYHGPGPLFFTEVRMKRVPWSTMTFPCRPDGSSRFFFSFKAHRECAHEQQWG
jgi:hypothetical protein